MSRRVAEAEHRIIQRDPHAYCAHPHLVRLADGDWLVVFNQVPRRGIILHPPQDPLFRNFMLRSSDEGRTWAAPVVVPDYGWSGVECAGLTPLRDGQLLLHQWRFRWLPLPAARVSQAPNLAMPAELARDLALSPELDFDPATDAEALMPWARSSDGAFVHCSTDGGRSWCCSRRIETRPFAGGYTMRGAVELPDGGLVLPLCDIPAYERVYVMHSADHGVIWGPPVPVAAVPGLLFEEPAPLLLPDGRILMLLRENVAGGLHQVHSDDGGHSWSPPMPTPIDGYPAHLLLLADGRVLCTYGFRKPGYEIRAVLSENGGRSWKVGDTRTIRGALPNRDLGYPCTLQATNGELVTCYYAQEPDGVTSIQTTRFRL